MRSTQHAAWSWARHGASMRHLPGGVCLEEPPLLPSPPGAFASRGPTSRTNGGKDWEAKTRATAWRAHCAWHTRWGTAQNFQAVGCLMVMFWAGFPFMVIEVGGWFNHSDPVHPTNQKSHSLFLVDGLQLIAVASICSFFKHLFTFLFYLNPICWPLLS